MRNMMLLWRTTAAVSIWMLTGTPPVRFPARSTSTSSMHRWRWPWRPWAAMVSTGCAWGRCWACFWWHPFLDDLWTLFVSLAIIIDCAYRTSSLYCDKSLQTCPNGWNFSGLKCDCLWFLVFLEHSLQPRFCREYILTFSLTALQTVLSLSKVYHASNWQWESHAYSKLSEMYPVMAVWMNDGCLKYTLCLI